MEIVHILFIKDMKQIDNFTNQVFFWGPS